MPRKARTRAESGIYYVMLRGINCQQIFADEEDHEIKAIRAPLIDPRNLAGGTPVEEMKKNRINAKKTVDKRKILC